MWLRRQVNRPLKEVKLPVSSKILFRISMIFWSTQTICGTSTCQYPPSKVPKLQIQRPILQWSSLSSRVSPYTNKRKYTGKVASSNNLKFGWCNKTWKVQKRMGRRHQVEGVCNKEHQRHGLELFRISPVKRDLWWVFWFPWSRSCDRVRWVLWCFVMFKVSWEV